MQRLIEASLHKAGQNKTMTGIGHAKNVSLKSTDASTVTAQTYGNKELKKIVKSE